MATGGGVASREGLRYAEYLPPSAQRPDADIDHAAVSLRAAASAPRAPHPEPRTPTPQDLQLPPARPAPGFTQAWGRPVQSPILGGLGGTWWALGVPLGKSS